MQIIMVYYPEIDGVRPSSLTEDNLGEPSLNDFMENGPLIYFFDD